MTLSDDKRKKLLYILQYLLENTDENHVVKVNQIIAYLDTEYNIPVERKTVYTDIKLLQDFGETIGIEIEYSSPQKGYRVLQREFELDELQLLIDSVQSSKFITERKAKTLTDKLKRLTSRHNRATLERRIYVANRIRNMNDSAFYGVDNIHTAIAENMKISFRYFSYSVKKEKVYNKKIYRASPYALIWNDGNYYLLAYESGKMKHFRVDKMDSVKLLDEKRDGIEAFKALKLSERSTKLFSMYSGKEERVTLQFSNGLAGVVIDRFGKDVSMRPNDDKHFTVSVLVEISPQFFGWLCGLETGVEIVAPASVAQQMREHVEKIAGLYQESK